jgi:segregation and condensation protein A
MMYQIKQEKFEGPLDLLLELIQQRKLSINEISLAAVTDEFIGHLKELEIHGETDNEILAEFLVVASQLLLIKSRSLLPQFSVSAEEEASIEELENRLREYQRIKELAQEIGALARGGPKSFPRPAYAGREITFSPPKHFTARLLVDAFERLLEAIPKVEKLIEEKIKKVISLEEKIKHLQTLLAGKVERAFSELIAGAKEKVEIIVSFLAILELAKQKLITVKQQGLFSDITIQKMD